MVADLQMADKYLVDDVLLGGEQVSRSWRQAQTLASTTCQRPQGGMRQPPAASQAAARAAAPAAPERRRQLHALVAFLLPSNFPFFDDSFLFE